MFDHSLLNYDRIPGESGESAWIQRAIDDNPDGVLYIPKGEYAITEPLFIRNRCSLLMHPNARLIAAEEMDFVLTYDGNMNFHQLTLFREDGSVYDPLNVFIKGGDIDGNGKASCLLLANAHHFTLADIALHNGKKYGLNIGGNLGGRLYEVVANNVYCKCTQKGLAGNVGIYTNECDEHFTDCFVVDYTVGVQLDGGGNRLTRVHVWGGTVPPKSMSVEEWSVYYGKNKIINNNGQYTPELDADILSHGMPEMLENSVNFLLNSGSNMLESCYADTATIGYKVIGDNNVLMGCGTFNNRLMGLRNMLGIENHAKKLTVTACTLSKGTESDRHFSGNTEGLIWEYNNIDKSSIL